MGEEKKEGKGKKKNRKEEEEKGGKGERREELYENGCAVHNKVFVVESLPAFKKIWENREN